MSTCPGTWLLQGPDSESVEISVLSVMEGKWLELDPLVSHFISKPGALSRATLMGEGQTALFGRATCPGDWRGRLVGMRQEGDGFDGDGGAQVPVYTAR